METKKCTKCKLDKELSGFNKNKKSKDGLASNCKECKKKWTENNKERLYKKNKEWAKNNPERTSALKIKWKINNPDKVAESNKNWTKNNPDKVTKNRKEWRKNNPEKYKEDSKRSSKIRVEKKQKKFLENNKSIKCDCCHEEKLFSEFSKNERNSTGYNTKCNLCSDMSEEERNKIWMSSYYKQKRASNPLFKLTCNIRRSISRSITGGGYKKISKTAEILGCTYEEFMVYLESKFEPWMTWDNYGKYKKGEFNVGWMLIILCLHRR